MKSMINVLTLLMVIAFVFSCEKENIELRPDQEVDGNGEKLLSPKSQAATLIWTGSDWMSLLPNSENLSQISIPGTHDSGARFDHPLLSGTAKCQDLTIPQQLVSGVRYLDIRCRHYYDAFTIHHGVVYQNLNFDDVISACLNFLQNNPGETIIMSVKEEYDPSNNTRSFEQTFDSYVQKNPSKWYLGESIPDLGQVRGKIVLLRRFGASNLPKGIAATNWADNTTFDINNSQSQLRVQDNYKVPDNNVKWNNIEFLLNEAKVESNTKLYLNYTSGYRPGIFGIPNIPNVSNSINPLVTNYFNNQTSGRFGIVIMDFANSGLTEPIIETNY